MTSDVSGTGPVGMQALARRRWLGASLLAGTTLMVRPGRAAETPATATTDRVPMALPRTEFVYEAVCDLEPTLDLGTSPWGERRMVPIAGGTFEGPGLKGKVLPGGADRQLIRRDGARALDAVYELQTHDGVIISVRNRVLVRPPKDGSGRYAFSTLEIVAPEGRYGWLNDHVHVGTLDSLRPQRDAVVIRVFRLV
ncbi:DUF3237 domain-containing protein [Curvibacter gracilis]|uniref:DUF3237 domain-containing protein n=1 Tax=Curvibacter gracilis TaxID=230310 RepID=UPI0004B60852|nr:DUF3237 domain-containing protein [Curvibacter gracilis]